MNLAEAVVAEFATEFGFDEGLDEEGKLVLLVDERWLLTIASDSEDQFLLLFVKVCDAVPEDWQSLSLLLQANFLWQETAGATLAIEPQTQSVVLHRRLEGQFVTAIALRDAAQALLRTAIYWSEGLNQLGDATSESAEGDDSPSVDIANAIRV